MKSWEDFKVFNVVDYEFNGKDGDRVKPICYVSKDLISGVIKKHWITGKELKPEYSTDNKTLFISFAANAEMMCHKVLNFENPLYILDLFAEFKCLTNGLKMTAKKNLLTACDFFGIKHSDYTYKKEMRDRILQGEPFSEKEKQEILNYCQQDVELTSLLFEKMKPLIDLKFALLRGRYMAAVAIMEYNGIPLDAEKLKKIIDYFPIIKEELILKIDQYFDVFEGTTFKNNKFLKYLKKNNISWELTPTGQPKTRIEYFKEQAKIYPKIQPLCQLIYTLNQLKLKDLQVGNDNRNRCYLRPFGSKTGRNYPSTSKFIFGPSTWVRFLIKPEPETALAYVDYSQQEIGIAAVLSGDKNLINDYQSGDPYLTFAKKAKIIPSDGTKETHPEEREICKKFMLSINYGKSIESFARDLQISYAEASYIVKWHKRRYRKYWEWNASFIDQGMLLGVVKTNYNWTFLTRNAKYRTLMNWPMQSHGSEILRLSIIICIENGIKIIAPIHDALLVESPINSIESTVKKVKEIMEFASECVLDFKIGTDVKIFKYPENFSDPRGEIIWNSILEIVDNINPNEIEERLKEKIMENAVSLDDFEPKNSKLEGNYSKKRRAQLILQPQNITEKQLAQKIKKKSGWSHISIMHLIREARETDFDLEHEIDWQHESYDTAKKRIQQGKSLKVILNED